jgi:hypothetical protein
MAITRSETQVQWSASDSVSVGSGSNTTSDEISIDQTCFQAKVHFKADNDGTPASGDTVDFYLLESLGDPDGSGTDEFATAEQGQHLAVLDTNANDPAETAVWIPAPFYKAKIYAVNNSGGRAITVSATIMEHRSS